jgi:hypothetical protein
VGTLASQCALVARNRNRSAAVRPALWQENRSGRTFTPEKIAYPG